MAHGLRSNSQPYRETVIFKNISEPVNQVLLEEKQENLEESSTDNSVGNKEKPFKCKDCNRSYPTDEKLVQHIRRLHKGENPFQCYMCDYSTYNTTLFNEHVNRHKGNKPYKCTLCEYRSVSKKYIKIHETRHSKSDRLKCKECSYIAMNIKSLHKHQEEHGADSKHQENTDNNQESNRVVKKRKRSNVEADNSKKMKCNVCKKVLANYNSFLKHTIDQHGVHNVLFKCQKCSWWSNQKIKVLLHLIHHPDQTVDENVIDISILRKYNIMK